VAQPGRIPVVVDINTLVDAVSAEPDPSLWESPPPVRGDADAMALAVLNEGLEFGLWLSPHILAGTRMVLLRAFGWDELRADRFEQFLTDIARRSGGVVTPDCRVTDCADWEDNRILELAETSGALLLISEDEHLLLLSPWRGIPVMRPATFVARVDAMRRKRGRGQRPQPT
jgi:predicted nucleic acid-binding protein